MKLTESEYTQKLAADVKRLKTELSYAQEALHQSRIEDTGFKPGDVVRVLDKFSKHVGKLFRISSFDFWASGQFYLHGYAQLKSGEFGQCARYISDVVELVSEGAK